MELNYQNACVASEPTPNAPTVVQMTDELNKRFFELRDAATKVTEGLLGERIDLPNGGEGPLPERMKWVFESLFRITDALKRSGGFVGG